MRDVPNGPAAALDSILIAHRGEPAAFPENTLAGFRSAISAGARYIETDVQMSADGVAVLSHDSSVLRVTGHDLTVLDNDFDRVRHLPAAEPERFGNRFTELRIATLDELVTLLQDHPDTHAFVELKSQSLARYGDRVVRKVLDIVAPINSRCTLLSFDLAALEKIKTLGRCPTGWVLPEWSPATHAAAERVAPDYLFVNRKRLPEHGEALWRGRWRWAVYTVDDPREIGPFLDRGFDLIETNRVSALLSGSAHR